MFDTKALAEATAEVVRVSVKEATGPLLKRIDELEAQVRSFDVSAEVKAYIDEAIKLLPVPQPPEPLEFTFDIEGAIKDAVALIERPKDGLDGKSVTLDDVRPLILSAVKDAVDAIPKAKDGVDGLDGVGLAGAMIDRDGELNLTTTKGEVIKLGKVVGTDGAKGDPGKNGFSLSDFDVALKEDGRTLEFSFDQGEQAYVVELAIPTMIYRGVFKEGVQYERGDTVTFGGSLWHCNGGDRDGQWKGTTDEKPGDGAKHWTLAAKRGRDGKDFKGPDIKPIGSVKI